MIAAATETLEAAAAEGDRAAMTELGKLALVGQGGSRSAEEGTKLLLAAAEKGDAEADAMISVLVGADAKTEQDWALALDYLGRSAARGWPAARAQYALLCSDSDLAERSRQDDPPPDIWRRMNKSIEIGTLIAPRPAQARFETPRIATVEGFTSPAECAWMIARARPGLARAPVIDRRDGARRYDSARTNSTVLFNILDTDFMLVMLHARIAATTGFSPQHLEETNVLHYAPGQEFRRHYDFFNADSPELKREIAAKGQRVVTFLVYLNEDFVAGETEFVELSWRYRGRPGDALVFHNVEPSGAPDRRTLHAGLATQSGEKWLLSQWIRNRTPSRA